MKHIVIDKVRNIRLVSYRPLCKNEMGLKAIDEKGHPAFVDSSCRREPDFENTFPSITSLCRRNKFAPHLYENDLIIYITTKGRWLKNYPHYRLVSLMQVFRREMSHEAACQWYKENSPSGIPSNCMVQENEPLPFISTAGNFNNIRESKRFLSFSSEKQAQVGKGRVLQWNKEYQKRADEFGSFIITRSLFTDLYDPPILDENNFFQIFNRIPGTRNPCKISIDNCIHLMKHAGIDIRFK